MKKDSDVVIVSACRTAIGKFGGIFKNFRASKLASIVLDEVVKRAGIEKQIVDDIILGDCIQHPAEANTARTAALMANFPVEVPACTIQRQCSSAMQATELGYLKIKNGDADVVIGGGVESMSSAYYYVDGARWGMRLQHGEFTDSMWELLHSGSRILGEPMIMGQTAENLAEMYNISREEQDEVALRSHNNAEKAIKSGKFKEEIVPVEFERKGKKYVLDTDEHVRYGLKIEDLKKLRPVFKKDGTVTAGNSSGLNDGAAALLLMSRKKAKELGLKPLARIIGFQVAGVDPKIMGFGPVPATKKLLEKTGISLSDIGLIELNEAFAAQYLACEKNLGLNREIVNVNGSGIGLGHPVGCTGARIIVSLLYEMRRRSVGLGLATLCVGGGMGMATIIENED
ncbi:acetyl-CoA C-acetyltransferase [Desulfothermus okinawensis JCM 13304]